MHINFDGGPGVFFFILVLVTMIIVILGERRTATVQRLWVADSAALNAKVRELILEGFDVATRDTMSALMVRRKQFSVPLAIVALMLFVIPALIYILIYAIQKNHALEIVIGQPATQEDAVHAWMQP